MRGARRLWWRVMFVGLALTAGSVSSCSGLLPNRLLAFSNRAVVAGGKSVMVYGGPTSLAWWLFALFFAGAAVLFVGWVGLMNTPRH